MESSSASRVTDAEARAGVLVVGTGFVADHHIAAIHAHPTARLAGVVDIEPSRAADAARKNGGIRWTTDLSEALAWPDVDAVIACTPNHTHADVGLTVAAASKHLLMEKPLATTVADAHRLVEEFADRGLRLSPAHIHRYTDYGRSVRAAIASGAVGSPRVGRLTVLGGWIWPDWRSWVLDPDRSGGHELHNGVHLLDLITWWWQDTPTSVYARGRKQTSSELDIYDYLEMVIQFAGGGVAVCEMSRGHRPATLGYRDVVISGSDGTLSMPWDAESSLVVDERGVGLLPTAGTDPFAAQLHAWLAGEATPPEDGALAVTMAVAVQRSIATGLPVQIAHELVRAAR